MKYLYIIVLAVLSSFNIFAQQSKNDVVLKANGDELIGKVVEIGDADIKFMYQGETLTYQVRKEDIIKITFGSGRIEFFNKPQLSSEKKDSKPTALTGDTDHHNKVAVLPFGYIKNSQSMG